MGLLKCCILCTAPVPYRVSSLTLSLFARGQGVCIDPSSDKHFPSVNCCAKPISRPLKPHNHNQRLNGREIFRNLQSQPRFLTSNDLRPGASFAAARKSLMHLKASLAAELINQFNIEMERTVT